MGSRVGHIAWLDLTVPNAEDVRDFYARVIGWQPEEVPMGDYADFTMKAPHDGTVVCGVCHARGPNAHLPPFWMVYITVADLDASLERCRELGGTVVGSIRQAPGYGRYCVIQDPAGAYLALFEKQE